MYIYKLLLFVNKKATEAQVNSMKMQSRRENLGTMMATRYLADGSVIRLGHFVDVLEKQARRFVRRYVIGLHLLLFRQRFDVQELVGRAAALR